MLKPQDVFTDYNTFHDWWYYIRVEGWDGVLASVMWINNHPCVPGSYGCEITLT